ncbi:MAG: carbon starvation protein A [Candidatus Omnitrophica bacterium]|nr:carbon starvation protein A [Candidatus Omnitrophota bacterium]
MSLYPIAIAVCLIFLAAYFSYGRFLSRLLKLNPSVKTPAHELKDGVDYIPTPKGFLLGQHFSAIAAAGPIVGPILAGVWFGWAPVLLWIVTGAIFFGAVHDFFSLLGSVRHRASSVVEMVRIYLGPRGHIFFMLFVWMSLIYVITAFTDLTAASFTDAELGGAVASSSILYLFIGLLMGFSLQKLKMSLSVATPLFIFLVVVAIWLGPSFPLRLSPGPFTERQLWNVLLLGYCFIASIIPVWMLLQPRGYLGGFFLYGTLAAGVIGLLLGGEKVLYPAFLGFHNEKGLPLFPLLFVTVACGACSGFHGIVCSGTTSKQIDREPDCHAVGYGGMLLEGLVAFLALSTVMILAKTDTLTGQSPDRIYAEGLGRLVAHFGIPREFARAFVLLAFTTFIYDTLDVATRLCRYIFQELTGWKGSAGRMSATLLSLSLPFFCVSLQMRDSSGQLIPAWRLFWTIFGTSNQLLAALTLMILTLWFKKIKKPWWICAVPMMFMMTMTLWSLFLLLRPVAAGFFHAAPTFDLIAMIALFLFGLGLLLIAEGLKTLTQRE